VYSLTLDHAIDLARNVGATIKFDDISQTPYFTYETTINGFFAAHIVWFIDARSINALLELVIKYQLHGVGIWNITIYNSPLWLVINSQFDIEKQL
jgi:Predicted glycosyl hydrolase